MNDNCEYQIVKIAEVSEEDYARFIEDAKKDPTYALMGIAMDYDNSDAVLDNAGKEFELKPSILNLANAKQRDLYKSNFANRVQYHLVIDVPHEEVVLVDSLNETY